MKTLALALALTMAPAALFATDVDTDYARGVDFSRYKTYAFNAGRGGGGARLLNSSLVADRIRSSVEEDLSARGLRVANGNPDLYINYFLGAREKQNVMDGFPYAIDPWYFGMWNNVMVTNYTEGTLVLDFVDAHTNKLVWRAYISKAFDEPKDLVKAKNLDKMIDKAIKKYPPQS